jgi:hypothetical protein
VIERYVPESRTLDDCDRIRDRLYEVFVRLSEEPRALAALNKSRPLSDTGLLKVAQIYWNVEGTEARPQLPIRPERRTDNSGKKVVVDIPDSKTHEDFATMTWTARTNVGATGLGNGRADSSRGASFRMKGARLAVLVAQRLVEDRAEPHPPVGGAVLVRGSSAGSNALTIVWPTADLDDEIDRIRTEGGDRRVALRGAPMSERQRFTETLDQVAAVLRPYVDEAMTAAYGTDWTEHVAEDDATRSPNGERFPVSKNDLSVLLKQIQHQQIKPWGTRSDRARIGGYAAEIRYVHNLWAHGGSLQGEHARLVDTAWRLLDALDLPIPESLVPEEMGGSNANIGSSRSALSTEIVATMAAPDVVQEAVDRLGETVRRPAQIFTAWVVDNAWNELGFPPDPMNIDSFDAVVHALLRLHDAVAEVDEILEQSGEMAAGLPRVLALLAKAEQLSVGHGIRRIEVVIALKRVELMKVRRDIDADKRGEFLARLGTVDEERDRDKIRRIEDVVLRQYELAWEWQQRQSAPGADPMPAPLLDPVELRDRAIRHLKAKQADVLRSFEWIDDQTGEAFDRAYATMQPLRAAVEQVSADPSRLLSQAIRAAAGLPEGLTLSHQALSYANFLLSDLPEERGESALAHLREAVAHQRMLIGLAPAVDVEEEGWLASLLHMEGRLCNDLGRSDEAIRAFARADEIIDRYPLADPSLHWGAIDHVP